jgi:hypothetical protein
VERQGVVYDSFMAPRPPETRFDAPPFSLAHLMAWQSLAPVDWFDAGAALRLPWPSGALVFWSVWTDPQRGLEVLKADRVAVRGEVFSKDPLHDGYICALELVPLYARERARPEDAETIAAFIAREKARHVERHLVEVYGRLEDHVVQRDFIFWHVDYPAFDNGNFSIGFGAQVGTFGCSWLFSRPVFAHR